MPCPGTPQPYKGLPRALGYVPLGPWVSCSKVGVSCVPRCRVPAQWVARWRGACLGWVAITGMPSPNECDLVTLSPPLMELTLISQPLEMEMRPRPQPRQLQLPQLPATFLLRLAISPCHRSSPSRALRSSFQASPLLSPLFFPLPIFPRFPPPASSPPFLPLYPPRLPGLSVRCVSTSPSPSPLPLPPPFPAGPPPPRCPVWPKDKSHGKPNKDDFIIVVNLPLQFLPHGSEPARLELRTEAGGRAGRLPFPPEASHVSHWPPSSYVPPLQGVRLRVFSSVSSPRSPSLPPSFIELWPSSGSPGSESHPFTFLVLFWVVSLFPTLPCPASPDPCLAFSLPFPNFATPVPKALGFISRFEDHIAW